MYFFPFDDELIGPTNFRAHFSNGSMSTCGFNDISSDATGLPSLWKLSPLYIGLGFFEDFQPVVAKFEHFVCHPLVCKMTTTWLIMTFFQNIYNLVFSNTFSYYHIRTSINEVTIDPTISSTLSNYFLFYLFV